MTVSRTLRALGLALAVGLSLGAPTAGWARTEARTAIRQIETQYQGRTSHSVMRMKVVTKAWIREMTLENWGAGRDKMLSKILSPKKDAGTATLKIGDEMWNYLPKIDRLMKIPSSLMGDRWMGSHLTNDDLVKTSKVDELYDFKVNAEAHDEIEIVATPRANAAVVWGRIVYRLDAEHGVPLSVRYYDEDNELVRTLEFDQVRTLSGRRIPTRMRFVPSDAPGEYTEVEYERLDFDQPQSSDLYSIRSLRR